MLLHDWFECDGDVVTDVDCFGRVSGTEQQRVVVPGERESWRRQRPPSSVRIDHIPSSGRCVARGPIVGRPVRAPPGYPSPGTDARGRAGASPQEAARLSQPKALPRRLVR